MARLKRNSLLSALQGTIGKEIVFKQYADKVVVSKYPDMSKVKPSELQKLQRRKMTEANAYASAVLRDPRLKAKYERKLKKGESVFHKAKKEFFQKVKKKVVAKRFQGIKRTECNLLERFIFNRSGRKEMLLPMSYSIEHS